MRRHRAGGPVAAGGGDESSSDEEDAFSALSKRKNNNNNNNKKPKLFAAVAKKKEEPPSEEATKTIRTHEESKSTIGSVPLSSSTKRHHGVISDTRKAKMDALLMELQEENKKIDSVGRPGGRRSHYHDNRVPDKKGSFVEPGEEHLTTNIFVGNLAPSITEEEMTELFRQFGDLYSVKIMWPRTPEERARNRHTGFVCFMNRRDAEDAMEACSEADPFNVGRRLMMRWGKNVKKIVKRGTGGIPIAPISQKDREVPPGEIRGKASLVATSPEVGSDVPLMQQANDKAQTATPLDIEKNKHKVIRVQIPTDTNRTNFISTVASFVAKDGFQLEGALIQREGVNSIDSNSRYDFLLAPSSETNNNDDSQRRMQEHIYYKWRVYSFCQGDGFHKWKMEPFTMFSSEDSCIWIPPSIVDKEAAEREELEKRCREEEIIQQKKQRRFHSAKRDYVTGRQLEQQRRKGGADGSILLTADDMREFDKLFKEELCASRKSICEAMAFCFEKSFASKQLANLLKDLLMVKDVQLCDIDTMIARIFLLSDILFNSQQPGVRNAFHFRDAIQSMSPAISTSLGIYKNNLPGRMSQGRLTSAFNAVLAAWTNWGVFDPVFMDELEAKFHGREIEKPKVRNSDNATAPTENRPKEEEIPTDDVEKIVYNKPKGKWIDVAENDKTLKSAGGFQDKKYTNDGEPVDEAIDGEPIQGGGYGDDPDGEPIEDDDADGEPIDEDADGEPIDEDADGEPIDEDADGEPIDEDADGEPIDEDADGEPMDEDADGEPMDEDADGEPIEDDVDGKSIDNV